MSIKHTLFISALTVSAAFTLAATGQFGNNQQSYNHLTTPITVQARRRHRRYRVRFRRIRRRHTTRRARRRHSHSRFVVHFRRITPKRRHQARRVHHYHIDVEGVDGGWTTSYHYYKSESAKIQHAIDVQTAKDEEAEGIDPSQNNEQNISQPVHQAHRYHIDVEGVDGGWTTNYNYYKLESARIQHAINVQTAKDEEAEGINPNQDNNSQDNQQTDQPSENSDNSSESTDTNDQSSNNSVQNNINEMNSETLADMNQDREENGEQPYQESQALNQIANMRAQQYAANPNTSNPHIDPNTGNRYVDEDAQQLGYNLALAENVDSQAPGEHITYYGQYIDPKNGNDLADQANDDMMNHDSFCGNGHRDSILSNANSVGVGSAYNQSNNTYYLAEDFAY